MTDNKKYQIRIRKDLSDTKIHREAEKCLGLCVATEIRTLEGSFLSMKDAFEKMSEVHELTEYEIISVILIDSDNSDQLGENFDWEENDHG